MVAQTRERREAIFAGAATLSQRLLRTKWTFSPHRVRVPWYKRPGLFAAVSVIATGGAPLAVAATSVDLAQQAVEARGLRDAVRGIQRRFQGSAVFRIIASRRERASSAFVARRVT